MQGIALLNIPSIYGGSNLWGENVHDKKKKKKLPRKRSRLRDRDSQANVFNDIDLSMADQDIGDKLIEVVGLENCMHVGQVKAGLRASGRRLAQCSNVVIRY